MAKKSNKETVSEEIQDQLPETEKSALNVMKASGSTGKKYRLKSAETQYVDVMTGWTLTKEQVKELPQNVSRETLERIKEGFLVEVGTE